MLETGHACYSTFGMEGDLSLVAHYFLKFPLYLRNAAWRLSGDN